MLIDLLIKIIVFLLPTQLGLHFWPAFSRVAGIKIDYLSPTLYLLDPFLIALVALNFRQILFLLKKHRFATLTFILFVVFNTLFSISPLNSLFWWLRTILYFFVFISFRLRKLTWENIHIPLFLGTLAVVFIEIAQLYLQSSVGGPLYFLGERAFSGSTPGLGHFNFLGRDIIRPMSIFSHANSLAGYLLLVFYLFTQKSAKIYQRLVPFLGILLSLSKSAIVALACVIFNLKPEIMILGALALTLIQPLLQNFSSNWQSLSDRLFYYPYLNKISPFKPITGIGLGSFIPSLGKNLPGSFLVPDKLQPIHNLIFLYVSELGVLGTVLLGLTLLVQKVYRILSSPPVLGLIALVLFTGAFDHYSWTLPQNKLIFLLALSIMF